MKTASRFDQREHLFQKISGKEEIFKLIQPGADAGENHPGGADAQGKAHDVQGVSDCLDDSSGFFSLFHLVIRFLSLQSAARLV